MTTSVLAVHHGGGVGGAPVSLLKLLAGLDSSDFQSQAIFTEPGPILEYGRDLGLTVRIVPTGGAFFYSAHARLGPRSLARFVRTFPSAVRIARNTLRQTRPDVLHLNTSVLLAWAAAARRERIPVVWMVREVLGPSPWLRRWHARFILSHARRTVAISNAVRACFPRQAHSRVRRVYNAVDLAEFPLDLLQGAPSVRAELGIGPDRHVVMMLGSVQQVKGHWLMLEALTRLTDLQTDLVLVTGGAGLAYGLTTRGRVKRALGLPMDNLQALLRDADRLRLRERVHVTGFRRAVAPVVSAADVLVFPSLQPEGFGRPIIEAMALARPVVATNIGPSAEILGHRAGLLVPPDPADLANAIRTLLASPELRERMGRAGRERVAACFTLQRQVAEMSTIYREARQSA